MNENRANDDLEIQVAGHLLRLFYSHGVSQCGPIKDGIAFRFGGEGYWVVSLESLRKIVQDEDKRRSDRA
jgi:hypothetical protein